ELDRARRLAVEGRYLELHRHAPSPLACATGAGSVAAPASAACAPASLNAPGFGASFGKFFFTASRTVIHPPFAPGTAPSTRIRPRSTSVCTTLRLSVVTRSVPR